MISNAHFSVRINFNVKSWPRARRPRTVLRQFSLVRHPHLPQSEWTLTLKVGQEPVGRAQSLGVSASSDTPFYRTFFRAVSEQNLISLQYLRLHLESLLCWWISALQFYIWMSFNWENESRKLVKSPSVGHSPSAFQPHPTPPSTAVWMNFNVKSRSRARRSRTVPRRFSLIRHPPSTALFSEQFQSKIVLPLNN